MKDRPGDQARSTLIRAGDATIRITLGVWLILLALILVLSGLIVISSVASRMQSFLLGFLGASALACFAGIATPMAGSRGRIDGQGKLRRRARSMVRGKVRSKEKIGREATAKVLATGRRCRTGWKLVNGSFLAGRGDIDYVLVGPGGVFAIESKWASTRCSREGGTVVGLAGREPVSEARQAAREVEGWLRHGPPGLEVEVRPVVVIWGPGRIKFKEGWEQIDGVLVCNGPMAQSWLPQLDVSHLDHTEICTIANALNSRASRQIRTALASGTPFVLSARQ